MTTAERGRKAVACLRVEDPLVAWLVYRGELASAASVHDRALSFWTTRLLASTAMVHRHDVYEREMRLDLVRGAEFADRPSRLTGSISFPTTGPPTELRFSGGLRPSPGRGWPPSR
jgi:hypothetical protein